MTETAEALETPKPTKTGNTETINKHAQPAAEGIQTKINCIKGRMAMQVKEGDNFNFFIPPSVRRTNSFEAPM